MTTNFYHELKVLESFDDAVNSARHTVLPDDWWVIVTDVVSSTQAIERGQYKNVNSVGVMTIVAICNVDRTIEVPYVFGGDGCVCAIPPALEPRVRLAMLACKRLARDAFGLELRVGLVPAAVLKEGGSWLRVGKTRASDSMLLAALSGRGWEVAERLVKDPATRDAYEVVDHPSISPDAEADLSGYECRWQGVTPRRDCTLAIVVQALAQDDEKRIATYRRTLDTIGRVVGDAAACKPVSSKNLKLSIDPRKAWAEAKVLAKGRGIVPRLLRWVQSYAILLIGRGLMDMSIELKGISWPAYKDELVENSDCRKFDGTLKIVLDVTRSQVAELRAFFEREHADGSVVFGLHESSASIITCIVRSYHNNHMHFVDGADGGYAMAAKELKRQLAALKARQQQSRKAG